MATLVVLATGGGYITSSSWSYANARSGSGGASLTVGLDASLWVGQWSSFYPVYESFVEFDTSALGPAALISAVVLEFGLTDDQSNLEFTIEARLRDWGGGALTTSDWVAGASLGGLTGLATLATSGIGAAGAYKTFTNAALNANINKTGFTRMVLASSRTRLGSSPPGAEEWVVLSSPSGGFPPRLTITYEIASAEGTAASAFGFATAATGSAFAAIGTSAVAFAAPLSGLGEVSFPPGTTAVVFGVAVAAAGTAIPPTFSGTAASTFRFALSGLGVLPYAIGSAPPGWTGAVEYVVEIFDSSVNFGPGTKIGELWESRNLGWSRFDRLPGKGFLTLYQDSPHLRLFSPLTTHVRITRVTPTHDTQVYAGEFIDYDSTGDDVVLSFFDYVSLFAVSRSGYKTMYPKKRLGTEIAQPEVQAALSATYSPLGFVTMGTIQNPVGMDGTTEIITNEQFGTMDQLRLQILWDLAEMGRVNTANHVTFEVSRLPPYTFNFWKNRGVNQNIGLVLQGSVDDYQYLPNWTRFRNDLATLGTTVGGGATEIVKTNESSAQVRGRRQDVATIKTLLGITSSAVELDQQHAATAAMLTAMTQRQPALMVNLARDTLAPFEGWEICDTAVVEIDNGVDFLTARQRIVGVRGIYTEAGEDMGLILEPIPS